MAKSFTGRKRIRKSFGRIPEVAPMPNLIEVQKSSYDHFLQMGVAAEKRTSVGLAGSVQVGLPDPRLLRARAARIRRATSSRAEIRRRGMPAARHDLRRAAEGDAAPGRLGRRRGDRRALDPRHQGAGRLHGRHAAHDGERHLHHQRHRARHRLARCTARPACSSTTTRARPIPRASISSPRASFPIAARGSISSSTPRTIVYVRIDRRRKLPVTTLLYALDGAETEKLRAERAAERQDAAAARGAGHVEGGDPQLLLRDRSLSRATKNGWKTPFDPTRYARLQARRTTWSTPRPARSWPRPATKLTPRARARSSRTTASRRSVVGREELVGSYLAIDIDQRGDRRDLCRGRRRSSPRSCSTRSRRRTSPSCRCWRIDHVDGRPLYPQHAGDRQERRRARKR